MPVCGNLQRSELLHVAGLHYDDSNMEAKKSLGLNGNELGGVVFSCHSVQSACQRSLRSIRLCRPKTSSAIGAHHAQKVPTHSANHRVQNRRRYVFDDSPVFVDNLPDGIQTIWQDAIFPQKNGMRDQDCTLFDAEGACVRIETITRFPGMTAAIGEECSRTKSLAKIAGSGLLRSALLAFSPAEEKSTAVGRLTRSIRTIFLRNRTDRRTLASPLLMRLMAAPGDRLCT